MREPSTRTSTGPRSCGSMLRVSVQILGREAELPHLRLDLLGEACRTEGVRRQRLEFARHVVLHVLPPFVAAHPFAVGAHRHDRLQAARMILETDDAGSDAQLRLKQAAIERL